MTSAADIDAEWDNYISTLYSTAFKLNRVMEIYQGAGRAEPLLSKASRKLYKVHIP